MILGSDVRNDYGSRIDDWESFCIPPQVFRYVIADFFTCSSALSLEVAMSCGLSVKACYEHNGAYVFTA